MTMTEKLAIFRDTGIGSRLLKAAERFVRDDYIFAADEGSDHEPTQFERMMMEDMVNGLFADPEFDDLLQEAARGMKAGGADPEGVDLPRTEHASGCPSGDFGPCDCPQENASE
jgi:hypothetical protein